MSLAATSSTLYVAQRRRMRGKRLLARLWSVGKFCLRVTLCGALAWSVKSAYPLVREAAYFHPRTVEITGLTTLTREDVLYLLGIADDTTMWQLDLPRIGARLERHPYIKAVSLRREFPTTLHVAVRERSPYLAVSAGDQHVLIDDEGTVLRNVIPGQHPKVPHVILPQRQALEPGMRLQQQEIQRAFELLHAYRTSPLAETLRLASLAVQPSSTSVWRFEQYPFDVRLDDEGLSVQFGRLPLALRYIAQQGLAVRTVDLSFRKRIVIIPAS